MRVLVPLFLIAVCVGLLAQQIDISTSDLGRHIRNGELILTAPPAEKWAVLQANHYSVAAGDTPFVNHHWLSGVVFYLTWRAFSYTGLTLLYILLTAGAVLLSHWAATRASNQYVAAALAAVTVPIVVFRYEVRPEAFTYLLFVAFYAILAEWRRGNLPNRWLWVLPVLTCLWINLHIGFVFGFFTIGIFGLKVLQEDGFADGLGKLKLLAGVGLASAVAALLNPSGLSGLFYPFRILGRTEYPVAELASLFEVRNRGLWGWEYQWFIGLLVFAAAAFVWRWVRRPAGSLYPWPSLLLLGALGVLSAMQNRNMPLFCLLMVPVVADVLSSLKLGETAPAKRKEKKDKPVSTPQWPLYVAAAGLILGLFASLQLYSERRARSGFGLRPGVEAAAAFLRSNQIQGPYFNDFDIGGYLILNGHRVFVDGRPEAYPLGFFPGTYMPMLEDDALWSTWDEKIRFNAIAISMQDAYPGIERFILARVRDGDWAPVYADDYAILFVRRTPEHAGLIARNEIPRERFR